MDQDLDLPSSELPAPMAAPLPVPQPLQRLILWTLAFHPIAIAALFCYRAVLAWPPSAPPIDLPSYCYFSLTFAQLSLLGIWLGLGRAYWIVRIPVVLFLTALLPIAMHAFVGGGASEWVAWSMLGTFQMLAVAIPLLIVRSLGTSFSKVQLPATQAGVQFQIRHLLQWTVAAAFLLTFLRWVVHSGGAWGIPHTEIILLLAILAVSNAIVGHMGLWGVMGKGTILLRAGSLAAVILVLGAVFASDKPWGKTEQMIVLALQAAIVVLSLLTVRGAGYQLVSGGRGEGAAAPSQE
jgi:hypothetical protein